MAWTEQRVLHNGWASQKQGSIGDGPLFTRVARRVELWAEGDGTLTEATMETLVGDSTLETGTEHPDVTSLQIKRVRAEPLGVNDSVAYALVVIDYQELPPGF